ncbi:acylneuraminate cytidylyltransferase [Demequina aurantiaca]|uniref:acylneuraminate cytidylyltransferase n=1 Tax=Demequina aurantiaca TaxID=676200 RepID=UPI000780E1B4|nr:acylneuraminate cytidylyltransferase [Demequina aurantiaca]
MSEPTAIAIIPARGGSKGVPGKNVARVGGVPLVARAVRTALAAPRIGAVYVSTDDEAIAVAAREAGASIVRRPADLAGDQATSEDAILHALAAIRESGLSPSTVVFMQATSPFIDADALNRAVARVQDGDEDVVFSAFETYAFLWQNAEHGAQGVNHDHSFRPRRQDREPHFQETGAFYVMDAAGLERHRFRFFGRVGIQEVTAASGLEIDEPAELEMARALAPVLDEAQAIDAQALVMDFDGVHTDDRVEVSEDGTESVTVSRSDGMGLGMLRDAGLPMLILSKERNPVVEARGRKLGVETVYGVDEKVNVLRQWCEQRRIPLSSVIYVGNDVNDVGCLEVVGWPVVVPDAHPLAQRAARITLTRNGGRGALRELAEMILAGRSPHNV